jgi:hypothetical protein
VLSNNLKENYVDLLSSILDRKRNYKARAGIRRGDGYQRMEEIALIKMKCLELRDLVKTEIALSKPRPIANLGV